MLPALRPATLPQTARLSRICCTEVCRGESQPRLCPGHSD